MDVRSSYYCGASAVFILMLGLEARDNGCDPEFKATVEGCLHRLQGFPVLASNKTFLSGDWRKTDIICKRQLVRSASACVRQEYARCGAETQAWRSLCGFQDFQPDLLLQYGNTVCKHLQVLKQHWECQKSQHCNLKACLEDYRPALPSSLTGGMLKFPLYSAQCSYHAYTEYCHERNIAQDCPSSFYHAQRDIITSSRPFSCSQEKIQRLKHRFVNINLNGVSNAASDWSPDSVCKNLIGGWILVFVVTDVLGAGISFGV